MKSISITGELRQDMGKKAAKSLRNDGKVPCVLYGGSEPVHLAIDERKFKNIVYTPNTFLVELKAGDKEVKAILKDMDFHPVSDSIIHADFLEVDENNPFEVLLPVKLTGTSRGVLNGGILRVKRRKLKVKGLLKDMPEAITLDISPLRIGEAIRVRDVKVEGLTLIDPADDLVVSVRTSRKAVAEDEEDEDGDEATAEATTEEAES